MSDPPDLSNTGNYLQDQMIALINRLELSDLQRQSMKSRWLDQLLWLEKRATQCRDRYYCLRLITIIGGVIVPALVSFTFSSKDNSYQKYLTWATFGLSQVVAISAAVEEFFHYGDRFRQYRNSAEAMKIEGWQFVQLTGIYRQSQSHSESYPEFAERIESIIQHDVATFVNMLAQTKEQPSEKTNNPPIDDQNLAAPVIVDNKPVPSVDSFPLTSIDNQNSASP